MREICTSGSVRDGDGNVPIYSALKSYAALRTVREAITTEPMNWVLDADDGQSCRGSDPSEGPEIPHAKSASRFAAR